MPETANPLVTAVHLATQKLSSTQSVEETLHDVLELCVEASGAYGGTIYIHDPINRKLVFRHVIPEESAATLKDTHLPDDQGVAGEVFQSGKSVVSVFDGKPADGPRAQIEEATSVATQNMVTVALMIPGMDPIGVVQLLNKQEGGFTETDLQVLETVRSVSALAYLNSVLTEQANRAASLMGMGRVAHDIGNLSSALSYDLMYIEPMIRGLDGSQIPKSGIDEYIRNISDALTDLRDSIETIISYSRLISNLSAGQPITAVKKPRRMANVVANAASFLETQARQNAVALRYDIQDNGEDSLFDPLFIMRMVQNLVGNAIRAVRESLPPEWLAEIEPNPDAEVVGEVTVAYRKEGDHHRIEVTDTGPGMSPEIVTRILTGTAVSRWSASQGSGWGTKIVKELAAALGGTIEIDSKVGSGTKFSVVLPYERASDSQEAS